MKKLRKKVNKIKSRIWKELMCKLIWLTVAPNY